MKAEIIAVGTELLMGQVVNTNATFLADRLATMGIDVYYQVVVGDNPSRLKETLEIAKKRSNLVLLCGGLGPTDDDLTKDVLASFVGKTLVRNEEGYNKIVAHFKTTQRFMTDNNERQAMIVEGGEVLPNRTGLAVGSFYKEDGTTYILLPGPPSELRPMFDEQVKPLIEKYYPANEQLISRVLRFYGIGESQLVTELSDIISEQTNPTVAPYAKPDEVTLRLTVKTSDKQFAQTALDSLEQAIQERVGAFFYGYGEDNTLVKTVVDLLKERQQTVTAAESLTGGEFQALLTAVPGVSDVYPGGFITYSGQTKSNFLGIDPELFLKHGTVSKNAAEAMAERSKEIAQTDYALSFTGVAGPDMLEEQPIGTVWISLVKPDGTKETQQYHFSGTRNKIRHGAIMRGLDILRRSILKKE